MREEPSKLHIAMGYTKKQAIAGEVIAVLDAYTQNNRAAMAVIA